MTEQYPDEDKRRRHAAAQARYNKRKKADQWVRKNVWIPRKFEAEFDRFVALERYRWGALWDD